MPSYGMLRRVALVRTDVMDERIASIIRVKISCEDMLLFRLVQSLIYDGVYIWSCMHVTLHEMSC
jgi:hypothetical protein